jgi:hypothetical protein
MSNGTRYRQKNVVNRIEWEIRDEGAYSKVGSNKRRMGQNVEWEIKTDGNKVKSRKYIMGYTVQ